MYIRIKLQSVKLIHQSLMEHMQIYQGRQKYIVDIVDGKLLNFIYTEIPFRLRAVPKEHKIIKYVVAYKCRVYILGYINHILYLETIVKII